ncbi:C2 calcium-dependent domain-containing protein 4C-like [Falco rusticolus]|uniref:C2 calcium-dependent domain-containing protein 4C-like n=1 Tax=Falco peregrinus TaxID=8954 RepID=UPI000FFBFB18|nr:C2 calcium-dependent domain-containing protein 4C-like [Falco peregrinus]XP_027654113.2 C2 calcium-dependent domain-containing protein 4C-like [Falco cherrug]XP_037240476.1 C2 calcium-dependent domain-containing protein 4C-like [Falco rusticolus]
MSLWEEMLCPRALQGNGSRDIFLHVVTPDRIPQFTIPSLDNHKKQRRSGKGKGQLVGTAWRSGWDSTAEDEHGVPGSMSSCSNAGLAAAAQAMPDPSARAALSLPHLPKVTTPYGFVTLGQSPQVTSEEALFFHSGSGFPREPAAEVEPSWQEEPGCCRHPGVPVAGGGGCSRTRGGLRDHKQPSPHARSHKDGGDSQAYRTPAGLPLLSRCASPLRDMQITDVLESKEAEKRETRLLGVGCQRSSSSLELPTGTPRKNLLQRILGRHLAHPRQLKPTNFTLH